MKTDYKKGELVEIVKGDQAFGLDGYIGAVVPVLEIAFGGVVVNLTPDDDEFRWALGFDQVKPAPKLPGDYDTLGGLESLTIQTP